ncbi:MAG TPA: RDD family protein [Microlunatus sp.]|nr:RDD family protein [Microlunatus sp.]
MPNSRTTTGLPPGVFAGATGPRLLAALVEVGPVWLLVGLALLFAFVLDGSVVVVVLCLVLALGWGVLVWAQRATRAAGPGMRLDSLQVVGLSDGRPLGWGRVLLRALVFAGLTVTVVGLVAMLIVLTRHPRRQGWHDLAANAVVIKERPLAPPRPKAVVARAARPMAGASGSAAPAAKKSQPRPPAATDKPATKTSTQPIPVSGGPGESSEAEETVVVAGAEGGQGTAVTGSAGGAATTDQSQAADETDGAGASGAGSADAAGEPEEPVVLAEWMLRLDDGRNVAVEGLVLLGRNPQPRVGEEDATLIKVSDETRTVSKSHLAVGVDVTGLYVMDRGSTNGTMVTAPDGGQRPCPPGDLVDVPGGSVISFGDHWLEVYRPGH